MDSAFREAASSFGSDFDVFRDRVNIPRREQQQRVPFDFSKSVPPPAQEHPLPPHHQNSQRIFSGQVRDV